MKKKVQIVILSNCPEKKIEVLVFKTNRERGSFWQNVTGSVDKGESFDQAALRELVEETGIDENISLKLVKPLESEFFFTDRKDRKVHEKVYYYFGEKWDVKMCEEHVEYKWIAFDKVKRDLYKYESNYQALLKSSELIK